MDKETNKILMELAERILREWEECPLFKDRSSKRYMKVIMVKYQHWEFLFL